MIKQQLWIACTVGILFTAIGIFLGLNTTKSSSAQQPISGLLSQSMPDASGQLQDLRQWKNRKLIVNFWATWCAPCVQEMPELSALQNEISAKHIQIIGIGVDTTANIAQFATKYQIRYPLYVAGAETTALLPQLGNPAGGLPFTLLIGENGQIIRTYLGRIKFEQLRRDLTGL